MAELDEPWSRVSGYTYLLSRSIMELSKQEDVQRILCVLARADREMTNSEIIDHDSRLTRYTSCRHFRAMEEEELITRRLEPQGGPASLAIHYFRITLKGKKAIDGAC